MAQHSKQSSRAIIVLGMHRSGTSVLTRGLQGLGVYLGDDFLNPQADNPTGYWENKNIFDLNERLLKALGLNWESTSPIEDADWGRREVQDLGDEAATCLLTHFLRYPLWGFKDPRTIRVLPFWRAVFQRLGVDDQYVVAIRNPLSVASSLLKRQGIAPATSHMLWLVYVVPFLHEIAEKPFVVTDYDLLLDNPRRQLERVRSALRIPFREADAAELDQFSRQFVDPGLRHGYFSPYDFDAIPVVSPLAREAYLRLYESATDQPGLDAHEFWSAWKRLGKAVEAMITDGTPPNKHEISHPIDVSPKNLLGEEPEAARDSAAGASSPDLRRDTKNPGGCEFRFSDRPSFLGSRVDLFAVIGAQRTGTNILREILNTNEHIAMLGEILSPSSAPAHWDNFLRSHPSESFPPPTPQEAEVLLDKYFEYVLYRIHNHWVGADKSRCHAIGIDIKYNQLRYLAPSVWDSAAPPFLLLYLKSRGATLIHTTRRNVIHCAISWIIAAQRNVWHDYEGMIIDRRYQIDVEKCLEYARSIVRDRDAFLEVVADYRIAECCYEELAEEIGRVAVGGEIPDGPGPLQEIAKALGVPFGFRYDGRLRKAINVPYSQLLLNQMALSHALMQSEFSDFATTLE